MIKNIDWIKIKRLLLYLFCVAFCISVSLAVAELLNAHQSAKLFEDLSNNVFMTSPSSKDMELPAAYYPELYGPSADIKWEDEQMARYAALNEINPDFWGWIYIEDTQVNYPVVHTPNDPEHYLRRGFDGKYSIAGVPFLDGDCYEGCGNYIVYGHRMNNGTMFKGLLDYADQEFWAEHPAIRFDTLNGIGEYEVVGAFYSRVYTSEDHDVFRYYQYKNLTIQTTFEDFVSQVKRASIYDTGIEPEFGNQLLTLSTCDYSVADGRFVVVACKSQSSSTAA